MKQKHLHYGTITPALLVITGAFLVVIYGLLILLTMQLNYSHRQVASEQALNIAEAGVNYYRWHLAHDPVDFTDGTGQPGPYIHIYHDPQGKEIGEYSLHVEASDSTGSLVTIRSTGTSYAETDIQRTIEVQYGKPSFTKFAFLNHASAWYGTGITIQGDIHSNNGIRMDGTNLGRVTSAQEEYRCGSETGCSPNPLWKPGVWGDGGDQALWEWPVPPVDFDSVAVDFTNMRDAAIADGLHLGPSGRNAYGYHLTFAATGTVTVSKVTRLEDYQGYLPSGEGLGNGGQGGCQWRDQIIDRETNVGTYNLADIPIIFVEDDIWVEGVVDGRVTVVAASFPVTSGNKNIWIRNNIVYETSDGSDVLGLIAQNDLYFVRNLPNDFRIDGALMAQKGRIVRHGYYSGCGSSSYNIRNSLTINGAMISYNKSYWNYMSGGTLVSGFRDRYINYDATLLYAPPPYFPTTSEYQFISWKEE